VNAAKHTLKESLGERKGRQQEQSTRNVCNINNDKTHGGEAQSSGWPGSRKLTGSLRVRVLQYGAASLVLSTPIA